MWNDFYAHMTEKQLGSRPRPMAADHGFYILLEAMGGDGEVDRSQFERVLMEAIEAGTIDDAVIAQSERERDAIWAVREDFAPGLEGLSTLHRV